MTPAHRGVPSSHYCSYIIRVRPLDAADFPSVRQVYIVEEVSECPKRMQFDSVEEVISFIQSSMSGEHGLNENDGDDAKNLSTQQL